MPYIKFGSGSIRYRTSTDNAIVVSQVLDTGMSYYIPKLITTRDQLDIYFGKSFTERDYFEELLGQGVGLFLYRPISETKRSDQDGYIDLDTYTPSSVYISPQDFPETGDPEVLYLTSEGLEYIWTGDDYIDVTNLQQNIKSAENYESYLNRDTLRLLQPGSLEKYGFTYCHPKYPYTAEYTEEVNTEQLLGSMGTGMASIEDDYSTCAFRIDFSGVLSFYADASESAYYFTLPDTTDDLNSLIWYRRGDLESEIVPIGGDFIGGQSYAVDLVDGNTRISRKTVIQETIEKIKELGYTVVEEGDSKYLIYASRKLQNTSFYELPGLTLESDQTVTQNILSVATDGLKRIEFCSKTIGPSPDNEDIKVTVEKVDYYESRYRVTVSRYDYVEIHEANLFQNTDLDGNISNLEATINRDSLLVECKIFKAGYKRGSEEAELPCGSWYLHRSTTETITPGMFWNALEIMQEEDYEEDFLLVPKIQDYVRAGLDSTLSWYSEYQDLYSYAVSKNCQVLIENRDTDYTYLDVEEVPEKVEAGTVYVIQEGDTTSYYMLRGNTIQNVSADREITNPYRNEFFFNWTGDTDNRLIYFYRGMEVYGYSRPGWYVWLGGILSDVYSRSTKYIKYYPPVGNAYIDEPIETTLEKYKSNYLVDNGQTYYYKKYLNHPGNGVYNTSGLTRFCVSKVARELQNGKWNFLGSHTVSERNEALSKIINTLEQRFGLYRHILSKGMTTSGNKMTINLELYVSELVDKSINLSVTLNYILYGNSK